MGAGSSTDVTLAAANIVGNSASDVAVYSGNRRNYTITSGSDSAGSFFTIVDNRAGSQMEQTKSTVLIRSVLMVRL